MPTAPDRTLIGLIADTHGLLRASVHRVFEGVELILHAGDVGGQEILDELGLIAPVKAVSGNTDAFGDPSLEDNLSLKIDGVDIHVSHGHELGAPTPAKLVAAHPHRVIVFGHTHRQIVTRIGDQLVVNPGAAGARRFDLEPSVALLSIENGQPEAEIVPLD
jgi:hypothetical protein